MAEHASSVTLQPSGTSAHLNFRPTSWVGNMPLESIYAAVEDGSTPSNGGDYAEPDSHADGALPPVPVKGPTTRRKQAWLLEEQRQAHVGETSHYEMDEAMTDEERRLTLGTGTTLAPAPVGTAHFPTEADDVSDYENFDDDDDDDELPSLPSSTGSKQEPLTFQLAGADTEFSSSDPAGLLQSRSGTMWGNPLTGVSRAGPGPSVADHVYVEPLPAASVQGASTANDHVYVEPLPAAAVQASTDDTYEVPGEEMPTASPSHPYEYEMPDGTIQHDYEAPVPVQGSSLAVPQPSSQQGRTSPAAHRPPVPLPASDAHRPAVPLPTSDAVEHTPTAVPDPLADPSLPVVPRRPTDTRTANTVPVDQEMYEDVDGLTSRGASSGVSTLSTGLGALSEVGEEEEAGLDGIDLHDIRVKGRSQAKCGSCHCACLRSAFGNTRRFIGHHPIVFGILLLLFVWGFGFLIGLVVAGWV